MFNKVILRSICKSVIVALFAMDLTDQSIRAETPYDIDWTTQIGANKEDYGHAVAVDSMGNVYISGYTSSSLDGPFVGGYYDAFLAKFNSSGNHVWTRQIGTSENDESRSLAIDQSGNVYVSGFTEGSLGSPQIGHRDAFLRKYGTSGDLIWSQQIGEASKYTSSFSVAIDKASDIFIAGFTNGNIGGTNAGGGDALLSKLDADGNLLWSRQIGSSRDECIHSVVVDETGYIYISGVTFGSLFNTNAGLEDSFLVKYDPLGNMVWSKQVGTSRWDCSNSVAVDEAGSVYIAGFTGGSLGGTNSGSNDIFMQKYDSLGNLLWTRQTGTANDDYISSMALDNSGGVFVTGTTLGSLCGDNLGQSDAFLIKYDSSGNQLWSQQIGTSTLDEGEGLAMDETGNVFMCGYTPGNLGGVAAGNYDAFVVKFAVPEPGSLVLLVMGALGLFLRMARRWCADILPGDLGDRSGFATGGHRD